MAYEIPIINIGGTDYPFEDENAQSKLSNQTITWQRYLTASDDVLNLKMGVYGISASSSAKPDNLPENFPESNIGTIVAVERGSSLEHSMVYICFSLLNLRHVWVYTGYGWNELATDEYVDKQIEDFSVDLCPIIERLAVENYSSGSEITSIKTQYRWLRGDGTVQEIGDSYPDWYVTNEIDVTPLTFYYFTASAKYAGHSLYHVLDADGNMIRSENATSSTDLVATKKMVFMPANAAKIRLASIAGETGAALYQAVGKNADAKWVGKKWVVIGDSLTDTNIRTTKNYHDYVAEKTGITVVNLGAGGTGYKREYAGEGPFIDRVSDIPLDADVVTIFGSGNDAIYTIGNPSDTSTDTLCGAINATIAAVFERITTCQLAIVTPTPWESYNPADDTNWMAQYSAAIVAICKRWGIPCLDLYHCSNLRPWDADFRAAAYSKDEGNGVHPDETGHALIAARFEALLESLILY